MQSGNLIYPRSDSDGDMQNSFSHLSLVNNNSVDDGFNNSGSLDTLLPSTSFSTITSIIQSSKSIQVVARNYGLGDFFFGLRCVRRTWWPRWYRIHKIGTASGQFVAVVVWYLQVGDKVLMYVACASDRYLRARLVTLVINSQLHL
jgi:hypothetical protein